MIINRKLILLALGCVSIQVRCGKTEIKIVVIEPNNEFKQIQDCLGTVAAAEKKFILANYVSPNSTMYTQVICDTNSNLSLRAPKASILVLYIPYNLYESGYKFIQKQLKFAGELHGNDLKTLICVETDSNELDQKLHQEVETKARKLLNDNGFDGQSAPVVYGSTLLAYTEFWGLNANSRAKVSEILHPKTPEEEIAQLIKELPLRERSQFGLKSVLKLFDALDEIAKPNHETSQHMNCSGLKRKTEETEYMLEPNPGCRASKTTIIAVELHNESTLMQDWVSPIDDDDLTSEDAMEDDAQEDHPMEEGNASIQATYVSPNSTIYTQVICDPASALSSLAPKASILVLFVPNVFCDIKYKLLEAKLSFAANLHGQTLKPLIYIETYSNELDQKLHREVETKARELLNNNGFDGQSAPVVYGSTLLASTQFWGLNANSRAKVSEILRPKTPEEKIAQLIKELRPGAISEFGLASLPRLLNALDGIANELHEEQKAKKKRKINHMRPKRKILPESTKKKCNIKHMRPKRKISPESTKKKCKINLKPKRKI